MYDANFFDQYRRLYADRQDFNTLNGIDVTEIRPGYCECICELSPLSLNTQGCVHGGLMFTLCDVSAGIAASTYGFRVLTVDCSVSFLRACRGKRLRAVGECIKPGRTFFFCEAKIFDEEDRLIAKASVNMFKTESSLEGMFEEEGKELRLSEE